MAEEGFGAEVRQTQADPKAKGETKQLQHRRLYLAGRIASLRDELGAIQKERAAIDTRLKEKPDGAEEKKLRQRRVYVTGRPESLRSEMGAATTELKEINAKLGHKAA